MPKIVAIHQPNFLPWLGFFDKIARSDVFVLLDNVQFPKKGGIWTNRVQILMSGQANWMTVPVDRTFHGTKLINEMLINNKTDWRLKMHKTIQQNYIKAPYFIEIMPLVESLINESTANLAEYNVKAIRILAERVGLSTDHLILSSTLNTEGNSTELLISITKAVGGDAYMCGGGANGYQEDEKFTGENIQLKYQEFKHPVYAQFNTKDFIPGLSIVDVLMNCGFDGVNEILKRNSNTVLTRPVV